MRLVFSIIALLIAVSVVAAQSIGGGSGSINITIGVSPPPPTPNLSMSGPSGGTVNVASTNFTVTLHETTFNGSQTVTIGDGSQGGTVTPSVGSPGTAPLTVTPASSATGFTFTYTPVVAGNISISLTNAQSWGNPGSITYASNNVLSASGPSSGTVNNPSTNFTVSLTTGSFNGSQSVTIGDGSQGGTFTPSVGSPGTSTVTVTPIASATSFTFTYTPIVTGAITLTFTNAQSWVNPSPLTYTSNPISASAQTAGPSLAFYNAQPYYTCSANYYVSTTGNSGNNGTSPSTPWDVVTATSKNVGAGACINVAPGLYSIGEGLTFAHGGTSGGSKTGYVVWRCTLMPFGFVNGVLQGEGSADSCHMKGDGNTGQGGEEMFEMGANYLMFDGFEIDGNTAALSCFDNENGGAAVYHHIWLMNSTLHSCQGQSGVQTWANDWFFVIHNVWHDNANNSAGGGGTDSCGCDGSGFSIFEPIPYSYTPTAGNIDYWHSTTTNLTYHFVIIYNVGYNNNDGARAATDGNGIILDSFGNDASWKGASLIMGNIMFSNGARGINIVFMNSGQGAPITVANNTTYFNSNNTDINTTYAFEIGANQGDDVKFFNNIAYAAGTANPCLNSGNATPPCTMLDNDTGSNIDIWQTNISYPASKTCFTTGSCGGNATYPTTGTNKNIDGSDPKYTTLSATAPNFTLQSSSPAIGFGQAFDLWQQTGTVDAGACPFNSPGPVTSCP